MADTQRSLEDILALLADNVTGNISPQDMRDVVISIIPPMGSIVVTVPVETVIAGVDTWTKSLGTTVLSAGPRLFSMPGDGILRYDGASPRHMHVAATISFLSASANQTIAVGIAYNGVPLPGDMTRKVSGGADEGSSGVHGDVVMVNGDTLELYVRNETSAGNITLTTGYLFALGMIM